MDTFAEVLGYILLLILLVGVLLFAVPALELWLWGLVMVPVFGAPVMTFWQMFGLNVLIGLLFGKTVRIEGKK
jgi:hypothetical protein